MIDITYALSFAAFVIILALIVIFRINQIIGMLFRAKKTYEKLNLLYLSKITDIAKKIPFKKQEYEEEFEKACENSYDKNVKYILSQYYLGQLFMWVLYVIVLILLALISSKYSIGFETDSIIDSLIILMYVTYFISILTAIPTLIDRWPRAYATSVRLEEVLNLEDKAIKSEKANGNHERIEIAESSAKR